MSESRVGILYLIDVLADRGGSEVNLFRLVTHLDHSRYYPLVCPLQPNDSAIISELREMAIDVIPLNLHSIFSFKAIQSAWTMRRLVRNKQIQIIQTIHFGSDILGSVFKWFWHDAEVISSRRDMGFNELTWHHRILRRCTNRLPDLVLTNSKTMRDYLASREKIPLSRFKTIYNGVEIAAPLTAAEKATLRESLGLPQDALLLGCIANIQPIKGFEYLIEAAISMIRQGQDIHLVIIGGVEKRKQNLTSYLESLLDRVKREQLEERIHFLGPRKDARSLAAALDCFVLPSLSEGFSNAIIEAMAVGLPVIATAVGGNGEAVVEGETGLLVPPADPEALARAMTLLAGDKELRERMGAAARKRAVERYDIVMMIQAMENLYSSIAKNGN